MTISFLYTVDVRIFFGVTSLAATVLVAAVTASATDKPNPTFYKDKIYYPYTPTAGCLCTKEIWDAAGKRIFSDQQKLADAVKKAGGADGYLIVIELNDAQKIITADEILPYLPN